MAVSLLEENRAQTTNQFFAMEPDQRADKILPIIEITPEQVIEQAEKLYEFVTEVK
tara:strand:- start:56 stop:223 length:168 start_codon:yes stop_codon:yes gene_type:complete